MRVLSWNLFHGRDAPPGGAGGLRSRLFRVPERGATHVGVNRPLLEEFAAVLARDPWDVALLQEAPPRWLRPLCVRCEAHGASALTARNWAPAARAWLAERNPDLAASAEGGSNQVLVRATWRIAAVRRLTLTWRPERRRMVWARLECPRGGRLCVATLHATAADEEAAARDVERAAEHAIRWSAGLPLVMGGDLNLRRRSAAPFFDLLRREHGLTGELAPHSVDHILARGVEGASPARLLPAEWRELSAAEGRLRLSDHDAVAIDLPARAALGGFAAQDPSRPPAL